MEKLPPLGFVPLLLSRYLKKAAAGSSASHQPRTTSSDHSTDEGHTHVTHRHHDSSGVIKRHGGRLAGTAEIHHLADGIAAMAQTGGQAHAAYVYGSAPASPGAHSNPARSTASSHRPWIALYTASAEWPPDISCAKNPRLVSANRISVSSFSAFGCAVRPIAIRRTISDRMSRRRSLRPCMLSSNSGSLVAAACKRAIATVLELQNAQKIATIRCKASCGSATSMASWMRCRPPPAAISSKTASSSARRDPN